VLRLDTIQPMELLQEQKRKVEAEMKKLEAMGGSVGGRFTKMRDSAFARFPIVFVFLSTFGLIATFYGLEKMIDQIDYLHDKPYLIFLLGVSFLASTGALYKKLN